MNGMGKIKFKNGEQYEGEFFENKKHGKGRYIYEEGVYYEGGWKNNVR